MKCMLMLIILYSNFTSCFSSEISNTKNTQSSRTSIIKNQKQEIIKYFDDYMQHYNDYLHDNKDLKSINAMSETYHLPAFQIISSIPVRVIKSVDNLAKGSQRILDSLRAKGVSHIKWEETHIEILTEKIAFASNKGVRYKINGEILNKVEADYFLFKTNMGWKIITLILHATDEFVSPDLVKEIVSFFNIYLNNYNDLFDVDDIEKSHNNGKNFPLLAASEYLHIPSINISERGEFTFFESKKHIEKNTESFISQLETMDVTHISYEKIQIKMISENSAVASNIAAIHKSDGSILFKLGITYVLNKSTDGWKIVLRTMHTPENILKLNLP